MTVRDDTPTLAKVAGTCPACGSSGTLFVASGDYITCSLIDCPNPTAVADMLDANPERKVFVGRVYTQLRSSWSEWPKTFEEVCEEIAARRGDVKPTTVADEVLEVVVVRRARIHAEVTVEVEA